MNANPHPSLSAKQPKPAPPRTRFCNITPIEFDGKAFPSLKALAVAYGLTPKTIYMRLAAGRTGPALVAPPERCPFPGLKIDGKKFESIKAIAHAYRLPVSLVCNRYGGAGLTGKKLVEPHRRKPNVRIKPSIGGITYPTLAAACRAVGVVAYSTIKRRVLSGWTPEEALLTPVWKQPTRLERVKRAPK